ncbi:hypothetical protein SKAU_G00300300 [Synaphobranchus kaupii]|uniref:Uncharacterized protein n=1 Tax=Synaphobranchus kaupii TaxID=118154 RepID=A0A9Q1IM87_SYNKA|nr:hypothetical protein SKAU_G00300300 [Synaphobranchus kaupii]
MTPVRLQRGTLTPPGPRTTPSITSSPAAPCPDSPPPRPQAPLCPPSSPRPHRPPGASPTTPRPGRSTTKRWLRQVVRVQQQQQQQQQALPQVELSLITVLRGLSTTGSRLLTTASLGPSLPASQDNKRHRKDSRHSERSPIRLCVRGERERTRRHST